MQTVPFLVAALLTTLAAQTNVQLSDRYRDEFRSRPETARLSQAFSGDAWIVLLYATRQDAAESDEPRSTRVDGAMESLRSEVKTDGEWLFWYRLSNYNIAKQLTDAPKAVSGLLSMQDQEACRSALMAANRSRVMVASMPACELVPSRTQTRKP